MMSGYKLSKVVNERLANEGLKTIPSQMIYRYFEQKLIPFEIVDGAKVVSDEAANVWIEKYVAKRIAKAIA